MQVLEPLISSPRLPHYVQQLQEVLAREHGLRQKFYEEITEDQKAEFINGQVWLHSPVQRRHSVASDLLFALLHAFVSRHALGWVGHEKLLVSLTRNDYEPDVAFWRAERAKDFSPDQMRVPAPDFVVEVLSPSTEKNDREVKFEDYAAHGVGEYWIVAPEAERIERFVLAGESFTPAGTFQAGTINSAVIAGFEIPVAAVFHREANLAALRRLLS